MPDLFEKQRPLGIFEPSQASDTGFFLLRRSDTRLLDYVFVIQTSWDSFICNCN